jgi:hypothetical protein
MKIPPPIGKNVALQQWTIARHGTAWQLTKRETRGQGPCAYRQRARERGVGVHVCQAHLRRSKSMTKHVSAKPMQPVPEDNRSHKGPGSSPQVVRDDTKGHRDDEKHNIREQAAHGNLTQNTSNRRSG